MNLSILSVHTARKIYNGQESSKTKKDYFPIKCIDEIKLTNDEINVRNDESLTLKG